MRKLNRILIYYPYILFPYPLFYMYIILKGVTMSITIRDNDSSNDQLPLQFDTVDNYSIDFTDAPGSSPRILIAEGRRAFQKTRCVTFPLNYLLSVVALVLAAV